MLYPDFLVAFSLYYVCIMLWTPIVDEKMKAYVKTLTRGLKISRKHASNTSPDGNIHS